MQIYVHYLGQRSECRVLEKGLQVKHKNQDSKKSNSVTFSVTYFVMSFHSLHSNRFHFIVGKGSHAGRQFSTVYKPV